MQTKSFSSATRTIDSAKRQIEFVASTPGVDRYGDSIDQRGWVTSNFEKNPVFLWSHRSGDPPVGKVVNLTKSAKELVAKVEFVSQQIFPFAETIFQLYRNGFLSSVSVGFLPLEEPTPRIDEKSGHFVGYTYTKQELLEISATPLPANPEALAKAVKRGILTESQALKFEFPVSDAELFERYLVGLGNELDEEEKAASTIQSLDELFRALRA